VAQEPNATLYDDPNMTYLAQDGIHTDGVSMDRQGEAWYNFVTGTVPTPPNTGDYPISGASLAWSGINFATRSGSLVKSGGNYPATTGSFGVNLGLADIYLPANQAGSIKFNLINTPGVAAVLGWHSSAALASVFEALYAFLVYDGDNTISVYNSGNAPFVGLPATFGYQYRLNRDSQMIISIQSSVNGIDWKIIAKFSQPDSRVLYPIADVLGGHELQIPQSEGHVYIQGGGSVPPTQGAANPVAFTLDATTTNTNGYYVTSRRDNAWAAQSLLGNKALAANVPGVVFQSYDGTRGVLGLLGLIPSGTRASGANFYAGIYLEPLQGGGHNVVAVYYDGANLSAVVMGRAVTGWDYGVQRDPANGFGIVKRQTGVSGQWAAVGDYGFGAPVNTVALTTQASLFGSANASLNQPQYDGSFA
jgi:hypothetical protein